MNPVITSQTIPSELRAKIRIPYAMRRIPEAHFAQLAPRRATVGAGLISLARLDSIGKNTRLELVDGRAASLHEGDLLAVVLGNRYATEQFEGYARTRESSCDLLSMGGLAGKVESKHAAVADPSTLTLLGDLCDSAGHPLRLSDYVVNPLMPSHSVRLVVVVGTSMDAGKTYTAMSLIRGLAQSGHPVAGIKLTGTAAGRDTWSMFDAGARPALNFIDGGHASTYMCSTEELLQLHRLLMAEAATWGAKTVIMEIADGLLQRETAALLGSAEFLASVYGFVFATGDPVGAVGGIELLQRFGIKPMAISGLISQSPLAMREALEATSIRCFTAKQLQMGELNAEILGLEQTLIPAARFVSATQHEEVKLR